MHDESSDRTYPALATKAVQGLRKDFVVQQTEKIPLGARLGLKVPEHPSVGLLLKDADLSGDIELRVRLQLLTPCFDEVNVIARADSCTAWIVSGVSRTYVPTIETGGTISHCSRPLANNGPMIGIP